MFYNNPIITVICDNSNNFDEDNLGNDVLISENIKAINSMISAPDVEIYEFFQLVEMQMQIRMEQAIINSNLSNQEITDYGDALDSCIFSIKQHKRIISKAFDLISQNECCIGKTVSEFLIEKFPIPNKGNFKPERYLKHLVDLRMNIQRFLFSGYSYRYENGVFGICDMTFDTYMDADSSLTNYNLSMTMFRKICRDTKYLSVFQLTKQSTEIDLSMLIPASNNPCLPHMFIRFRTWSSLLPSLTTLILAHNGLKSDSFDGIESCTIRILDLSDNYFYEFNLKGIVLPYLQKLIFSNNAISNVVNEHQDNIPSNCVVDLNNNYLSLESCNNIRATYVNALLYNQSDPTTNLLRTDTIKPITD